MVFRRSTKLDQKRDRICATRLHLIAKKKKKKMRLWMIIGALAVATHASIAEITRNKNRGRGSMWW